MEVEELQRLIDSAPVHAELEMAVRAAGEDGLLLDARPGPSHTSGAASFLHGGIVATILDAAATFSLIDATGTDWSTVDLRVDYLRPAPMAPLRARARADHVGRSLGRATAQLTEAGSEKVLARAVGTFVRNG